MSTTFASTAATVIGVRYDCYADSTSWTVPPGSDMSSFTAAHDARCADCCAFGGMLATPVLDVDEVLVPDSTAEELFILLGLPAGTTPSAALVDGQDFLGRALLALALVPELVAVPADDLPFPAHDRRGPAFHEDLLTRLCCIGEHAAARGACVTWG